MDRDGGNIKDWHDERKKEKEGCGSAPLLFVVVPLLRAGAGGGAALVRSSPSPPYTFIYDSVAVLCESLCPRGLCFNAAVVHVGALNQSMSVRDVSCFPSHPPFKVDTGLLCCLRLGEISHFCSYTTGIPSLLQSFFRTAG